MSQDETKFHSAIALRDGRVLILVTSQEFKFDGIDQAYIVTEEEFKKQLNTVDNPVSKVIFIDQYKSKHRIPTQAPPQTFA